MIRTCFLNKVSTSPIPLREVVHKNGLFTVRLTVTPVDPFLTSSFS